MTLDGFFAVISNFDLSLSLAFSSGEGGPPRRWMRRAPFRKINGSLVKCIVLELISILCADEKDGYKEKPYSPHPSPIGATFPAGEGFFVSANIVPHTDKSQFIYFLTLKIILFSAFALNGIRGER